METINLIPKEERVQQTKTKVVKFSTILSIIILVIVGGVGGYFYYIAYNLKSEVNAAETNVTNLRSQINELAEIEIEARNLYSKSTVLDSIFDSRVYYSRMLEEIEASTPDSVTVTSFGLTKEKTVTLSGQCQTYNDIQDLSNRLLEKPLFTEVTLNSAGTEGGGDNVKFFIVVNYNEDILYGK
jgi:Tfp pilus assembly protein PilN